MTDKTDDKPWEWWIDQIKVHGVNLTTWEEDFIESVEGRERLTDKQIEIVERIYAERTS